MNKVNQDLILTAMAFLRDDEEGLQKNAGTLGSLLLLGGLGLIGYPIIKGILASKEYKARQQGFDEAVRSIGPFAASLARGGRGALDLPPGFVTQG